MLCGPRRERIGQGVTDLVQGHGAGGVAQIGQLALIKTDEWHTHQFLRLLALPKAEVDGLSNFKVSADFWLNLQVRWDLVRAQTAEAEELASSEDFYPLKKWPKVISQW